MSLGGSFSYGGNKGLQGEEAMFSSGGHDVIVVVVVVK
jgi:hypothetical protein